MHIGGRLIKEFDAFLHLFRSAAAVLKAPLQVPADDQFTLNRVLAGLGGPPALTRIKVDLYSQDSLPLLCLFLIMGKDHCPVGLMDPEPMARVRQLVHIIAHGLIPTAAGGPVLGVEEVSVTLEATEIALHPLITYNEDSEVAAVLRVGGRNRLCLGPDGGPFKVTINPRGKTDPDGVGPFHPVTVHATWKSYSFPFLQT